MDCDILIIGAGLAGSSAAYHLSNIPNKNIKINVIDSGNIGIGNKDGIKIPKYAVLSTKCNKSDLESVKNGLFTYARTSGTAVFEHPVSCIKMMVNVYTCSSEEFITHHGIDGAKNYLKLSYQGLELQKKLAKMLFNDIDLNNKLCEKGSLYLATKEHVKDLEEEYKLLSKLGAKDIELWDRVQTKKVVGSGFYRGIFFPHDAIIDSVAYSKILLEASIKNGDVSVYENCSPVVKVNTVNNLAYTTLKNGIIIKSKYTIIATGGLFTECGLAGILKPCWSYLLSVSPPNNQDKTNSPNFITWESKQDWCITKGYLRLSGKDHFSAFKPPRIKERRDYLLNWAIKKYPHLENSKKNIDFRYGVYSETPDHTPLVGIPHPKSKICYLLGCNAVGQATLSYSASLIPSLLGYSKLNEEQKEMMKILDIKRFAFLPAVLNNL